MSKINKIAAQTASTEANRLNTTTALGRTNRPKLIKSNVSQKTKDFSARAWEPMKSSVRPSAIGFWLSLTNVLNDCDCRNR